MQLRVALAVLALVAASAGAACAASGDTTGPTAATSTTFATEARASKVAVQGAAAVWSRYDATSKRYRLVVKVGALPVRQLRVSSRRVAFDVDLGLDRHGKLTAVYSRCAHEPEDRKFDLPPWTRGRGCALFSVSLAPGATEHRLSTGLPAGRSAVLPSISDGSLAFAATDPSLRGARALAVHLYYRRGGRTRRIAAGPLGVVTDDTGSTAAGPGATALDLSGRWLATAWSFLGTSEQCRGGDPAPDRTVTQMRLSDVTKGSVRVVDQGCETDPLTAISSPTVTAQRLLYAVQRTTGDAPELLRTRALPAGRATDAPAQTTPDTGPLLSTQASHALGPVEIVGAPAARVIALGLPAVPAFAVDAP